MEIIYETEQCYLLCIIMTIHLEYWTLIGLLGHYMVHFSNINYNPNQ